jgi:hypothetical protein
LAGHIAGRVSNSALLTLVSLILGGVAIVGCGSASSQTTTQQARQAGNEGRVSTQHQPRRVHHLRRQHHQRHPQPPGCAPASQVKRGLYHPERLDVLDPCRRVTGQVALIRESEQDGDLHFDIAVKDKGLLRGGNYSQQDGLLVVEFMPRDHGHLPVPSVGDRVRLVGAWVDDSEHSWNEIHPVWAVSINAGPWHRSGPQFGGSPPYTRSVDSLAACRTASGTHCTGYNGVTATSSVPPPPPKHIASGGKNCDPSYPTICIPPPPPDLDCSQIPHRNFKVQGSDPHHFDANRNGIGCES